MPSVQSKYLEEGGLAALADGVDAELVEAAGRRDRRVVVCAGLQGGNSIEKIQFEAWLEKRLEIQF